MRRRIVEAHFAGKPTNQELTALSEWFWDARFQIQPTITPTAKIRRVSPATPLQTNPPPPASPPSWKYVKGNPCGAKQSKHVGGRSAYMRFAIPRMHAEARRAME